MRSRGGAGIGAGSEKAGEDHHIFGKKLWTLSMIVIGIKLKELVSDPQGIYVIENGVKGFSRTFNNTS